MKHHYVPQFLLRAWSDKTPDGKVETFRLDLPGIPSTRHAPRHTAFENDLYALTREVVAGLEKHAVERRFLRIVDDAAARVRQKLDTEGLNVLSVDERMEWARFLMSLHVRQPHRVHHLRTLAAEQLHAKLTERPERYEELTGKGAPPTLLEWTKQQFPGLIESFGMSFFHEVVDNPEIGTKILGMRWWLWDLSEAPHELLISDQPCIFTHGINDPSLIIALPVGPRKAFMTTNSDHAASVVRNLHPRELVSRMNSSSLNRARVRVYATDARQRRFIENRMARIIAARRSGLDE